MDKLKNITIPEGYRLHIRNKKSKLDISNFIKNQKIGFKPVGVWLSGSYREDGWINFCINGGLLEKIDIENNNFYFIKYDKELILKLDTVEKVKEFHNKYSDDGLIDWDKVKNEGYYGVDFSEYLIYELDRYIYMWYTLLDCACQCIWDSRAIIDIQLLNI